MFDIDKDVENLIKLFEGGVANANTMVGVCHLLQEVIRLPCVCHMPATTHTHRHVTDYVTVNEQFNRSFECLNEDEQFCFYLKQDSLKNISLCI